MTSGGGPAASWARRVLRVVARRAGLVAGGRGERQLQPRQRAQRHRAVQAEDDAAAAPHVEGRGQPRRQRAPRIGSDLRGGAEAGRPLQRRAVAGLAIVEVGAARVHVEVDASRSCAGSRTSPAPARSTGLTPSSVVAEVEVQRRGRLGREARRRQRPVAQRPVRLPVVLPFQVADVVEFQHLAGEVLRRAPQPVRAALLADVQRSARRPPAGQDVFPVGRVARRGRCAASCRPPATRPRSLPPPIASGRRC